MRNLVVLSVCLLIFSLSCGKKSNSPVSNNAVPTLTTDTVMLVNSTSLICGGNITSDGGAAVSGRGVCWSTSHLPTTALATRTSDGSGTGVFTSNVSGLISGTTYYLRAYAINSQGTAYGNEQVFTTPAQVIPTAPVVTTSPVTDVAGYTAYCGGVVVSGGGAVVSARGVCYGTSPGPTILGTRTSNGYDTGSFTSYISSLNTGTKYYVRAYATNSIGTAYGAEFTFTTLYAIGTSYGGGIIAYVFQQTDHGYNPNVVHGLIAAPSDQSTGLPWGCMRSTFVALSSGVGYGQDNTTGIVNLCGAGVDYAAGLCDNLVLGGYSDWFLPSVNELDMLYQSHIIVGGFANDFYWSSTETSYGYAYVQNFADGTQGQGLKSNTNHVRAIRYF